MTAGSQLFDILSINNFTKIHQSSKLLLGMSIATRKSRLMKTGSQKISLDCPLNVGFRQPTG
jgi:hypothetical protein